VLIKGLKFYIASHCTSLDLAALCRFRKIKEGGEEAIHHVRTLPLVLPSCIFLSLSIIFPRWFAAHGGTQDTRPIRSIDWTELNWTGLDQARLDKKTPKKRKKKKEKKNLSFVPFPVYVLDFASDSDSTLVSDG